MAASDSDDVVTIYHAAGQETAIRLLWMKDGISHPGYGLVRIPGETEPVRYTEIIYDSAIAVADSFGSNDPYGRGQRPTPAPGSRVVYQGPASKVKFIPTR